MPAERLVAVFFKPLLAAELDARAAFRFRAIQARTLQIVRAALDVSAQLFLDLLFDLGPIKKPGGKRAKVGQEFHNSSGWAARAEAMAEARRFHPSASSRRRLRPADVSS